MKKVIAVVVASQIIAYLFTTKKVKKIVMEETTKGFEAVIAKINAATNAVAARIRSLEEKVVGAGMSETKEKEILAEFNSIATGLETLGADPADPVPDPTEEVPEETEDLPEGEEGSADNDNEVAGS